MGACQICETSAPVVLDLKVAMPGAAARLVLDDWVQSYFDERLKEIFAEHLSKPEE